MKSVEMMASVLAFTTMALGLVPATAQAQRSIKATASITGCTDPTIAGLAVLTERPSEEGVKIVDVTIVVQGLPIGKHAIHIHEVGICTPCAAAGGHFDPGPAGLSNPDGNHPFHAGDLINLEVKSNGAGDMHTTTSRISLSAGPLTVFDADGSAIIIHVNEDSYCPHGPEAGCAGGARQACGVLQLSR
jgi:Cu-Zn family superoxide dismutase